MFLIKFVAGPRGKTAAGVRKIKAAEILHCHSVIKRLHCHSVIKRCDNDVDPLGNLGNLGFSMTDQLSTEQKSGLTIPGQAYVDLSCARIVSLVAP